MGNLEEVLKLVQELTPEDRKKLRYELAQPYSKKERSPSVEPDWLLEGMLEELIRRGMWSRGMPPENLPKAYIEQSNSVKVALLGKIGRELTYVEKLALGQMAAQALMSYWPPNSRLSLTRLAQSMTSVLPAVEYSYPGYMKSGLLGMVIKRKVANG